jgi:hypothetical protein
MFPQVLSTFWPYTGSTHPILAIAAGLMHAALAILCLYTWRKMRIPNRLWVVVAAIQSLLMVDCLFGLRVHMTAAGRALFQTYGTYENRHLYQVAALAVLGCGLLALGWTTRKFRRPELLAGVATILHVLLAGASAISYHPLETLLATPSAFLGLGTAVRVFAALLLSMSAKFAAHANKHPES